MSRGYAVLLPFSSNGAAFILAPTIRKETSVLSNWRVRVLLVLVFWVATVMALALWISGRQDHRIS